ncbi:MAG: calcium-binding protein [Selenomonadaceae bacterium]|nr:calcium-binding protein [Selenomonadaceae bacterium]
MAVDNNVVKGGAGNDSIINNAYETTIDGGSGNDTIVNHYEKASINGGDDDDIISLTSGYAITVRAGKGNDTIFIDTETFFKNIYQYAKGDGDDTIIGFDNFDNLYIDAPTVKGNDFIVKRGSLLAGNSYSVSLEGDDLIVHVDEGHIRNKETKDQGITVTDRSEIKIRYYGDVNGKVAMNYSHNVNHKGATIHGLEGNDTIENYYADSIVVDAYDGDNIIRNYVGGDNFTGDYATIYSGSGNDTIYNEGSNSYIDAGDGDNLIQLKYVSQNTVHLGKGNNTVSSEVVATSVYGGDGNDFIRSYHNNLLSTYQWIPVSLYFDGGGGDDTIEAIYPFYMMDGSEPVHNNVTPHGEYYDHGFIGTLKGGSGNDVIIVDAEASVLKVDSTMIIGCICPFRRWHWRRFNLQ